MISYFPVVTGSLTVSGSVNISGGITASGGISISGSIASASFASTASFVALAQSASNAVSAQTASFANTLTVAGNLTAQTLVVQTITSSIDFVTGSTRFGSLLTDTHVFSGSISMNPGGLFVSSSNNVGIGTTTPTTKVHIYEPLTNTTAYLTVQNNRARNAAVYTVTTNGGFYAGTSIGTDTFNYQIYDGVAGVSRITVDSVGNIGMGTSNPVATLPTGSSILINNGWTANSSIIASRKVLEINSNDNNGGNVGLFLRQLNKSVGLDIWADNYYGNAYIDSRFDNSASYISFRLRTANQANIVNAMVIRADGNVGIGTTSPTYKLEVSGSSGTFSFNPNQANTMVIRGSVAGNFDINNEGASGVMRLYGTSIQLRTAALDPAVTITAAGGLQTNLSTISSFYSTPGNVASGGTTTFVYNQTSAEYAVGFEYCIVSLYAPSGTNLYGVAHGFVFFMADGATSASYISQTIANGWTVTHSATNAGVFTVTFTAGGSATHSNINIRTRKINRIGAG